MAAGGALGGAIGAKRSVARRVPWGQIHVNDWIPYNQQVSIFNNIKCYDHK